jgi:hypothetical protein
MNHNKMSDAKVKYRSYPTATQYILVITPKDRQGPELSRIDASLRFIQEGLLVWKTSVFHRYPQMWDHYSQRWMKSTLPCIRVGSRS